MSSSSASLALWRKFESYLDMKIAPTLTTIPPDKFKSTPFRVGVVGGGMAGLYSALLLQENVPGVKITIYEASDRIGGRVCTHKFSPKPYQYFDAGAMRLPNVQSQKPVLMLIEHLNRIFIDEPIEVVDFIDSCPEGNRVFVNNTKQRDGCVMSVDYAYKHCSELGFPAAANVTDSDNAFKLLQAALAPVVDCLTADFEAALIKYQNLSAYDYLHKELGWDHQKINYVETMTALTHEFHIGIINFIFLQGIIFLENVSSWKTIQGGLSRLPEMCASAVTKKSGKILVGSKVESISELGEEVQIGYTSQSAHEELTYDVFDAVIMTIPPPCVHTIPQRPYWGADLEQAMRTFSYMPVSKIGLRFHTRFWEHSDLQLPASLGGHSSTDLPTRYVVYPTEGLGDSGMGVLTMYNRGEDTKKWLLLSEVERIQLSLRDLQLLYPEVDIASMYVGGRDQRSRKFVEEASIVDWPVGYPFYHTGQLLPLISALSQPQGNVYFAGSHLSTSLVWIMSALESSKRAVQKLVLAKLGKDDISYL